MSIKKVIPIGKKFGRLTILKEVAPRISPSGQKIRIVECMCSCGTKVEISYYSIVRSEGVKSCGCYKSFICSKIHITHGMAGTRFHVIFSGMKARCNNEKEPSFDSYGGRGIKCYWETFEEFKNDMYDNYLLHVKKHGEKNTSIDRIDNDSGYSKTNCRWATKKEQSNNRRNNRMITFGGKTLSFSGWSDITGIKKNTLVSRIHIYGWPIEKALTQELKKKSK